MKTTFLFLIVFSWSLCASAFGQSHGLDQIFPSKLIAEKKIRTAVVHQLDSRNEKNVIARYEFHFREDGKVRESILYDTSGYSIDPRPYYQKRHYYKRPEGQKPGTFLINDHYEYKYNANGKLIAIHDRTEHAKEILATEYSYDEKGRLKTLKNDVAYGDKRGTFQVLHVYADSENKSQRYFDLEKCSKVILYDSDDRPFLRLSGLTHVNPFLDHEVQMLHYGENGLLNEIVLYDEFQEKPPQNRGSIQFSFDRESGEMIVHRLSGPDHVLYPFKYFYHRHFADLSLAIGDKLIEKFRIYEGNRVLWNVFEITYQQ